LKEEWEQPKILKTRSGKEFDSVITELLVATHFIKLGFKVSSFDQDKGQESVPDGLASKDGISCCYEVYAPRDWDGFELFVEDLRLYVLHLDVPWDFHFEISMDLINHFDGEGKLLWFNPWKFSDAYQAPIDRASNIEPFIAEVGNMFKKGDGNEFKLELSDASNNVITTLACTRIQPAKNVIPIREGSFSPPTLTGHAPEFMFDRLIQTRIAKKIGKKQASAVDSGSISALFVDISHLGYQTEFRNPIYSRIFQESILSHIHLKTDIVLFFQCNKAQPTGIEVLAVVKKASMLEGDIKKFLGNEALKETLWISP
jgi:hypothetical protein